MSYVVKPPLRHRTHPRQALEAKVAELERFCEQLAMENAVLKKAFQQPPSHNGTR